MNRTTIAIRIPTWRYGFQMIQRIAESKMISERGSDGRRPLQGPVELEEPLPDVDRDPVEHDRRDHLVRPDGGPQEAGDAAPEGPAEDPGQDAEARRAAAGGSPSRCVPTSRAKMNPTQYWPWPPMLKSPQRNEKATASAARISGVAARRVCWRSRPDARVSCPVSHCTAS